MKFPRERIGIVKDALNQSLGAKAYFEGIKTLIADNRVSLEMSAVEIYVIDVALQRVTNLDNGEEIQVRQMQRPSRKVGNYPAGKVTRRIWNQVWLAYTARTLGLTTLFPAPFRFTFLHKSETLLHWIPDFQHVFLPEFFTSKELSSRNRAFRAALRSERRVLLSSESSFEDAKMWMPRIRAQIHIAQPRFPVTRDETPSALRKLDPTVPLKFFYCPSQWWPHKGIQEILFALREAVLIRSNIRVVFSGLDPKNPFPPSAESYLKQIERLRLRQNCLIYPPMHYSVQRQLMAKCLAVIQASHFEGWNLGVSEAAQLGKPLIISDLRIHREQLGQYPAQWFAPGDWKHLSMLMVREWDVPERETELKPIQYDSRNSWAPFQQAFTTRGEPNIIRDNFKS